MAALLHDFFVLGQWTSSISNWQEAVIAIFILMIGTMIVAYFKDLYEILKQLLRWARSPQHGKTGTYVPADGNTSDRMDVEGHISKGATLFIDGQMYRLVVVRHDAEYKIVDFAVRTVLLDHQVGVGSWKPWSEVPAHLALTIKFDNSRSLYKRAFKKVIVV